MSSNDDGHAATGGEFENPASVPATLKRALARFSKAGDLVAAHDLLDLLKLPPGSVQLIQARRLALEEAAVVAEGYMTAGAVEIAAAIRALA